MTSKIDLAQVLKAYDYANNHPHKYLRGTTNWCAAVAHSLNEQAAPEAPRQEPIGRVSYIGNGFIRVRCAAPPALETLLYAAPLSPDHSGGGAGMVLPDENQLIEIARKAALESTHRYNYMPCLPEEAYKWFPHSWVIEAMRACLDKVKELNQ